MNLWESPLFVIYSAFKDHMSCDKGWGWFANWLPYSEGKDRLKEEAEHSRLVGCRFNEPGNLLTSLSLAATRPVDIHTCPAES